MVLRIFPLPCISIICNLSVVCQQLLDFFKNGAVFSRPAGPFREPWATAAVRGSPAACCAMMSDQRTARCLRASGSGISGPLRLCFSA